MQRNRRINLKKNNKIENVSGGGVFSNIIGKIKNSVKNITNKIQQIPTGIAAAVIPAPEKYTANAERTLKRYGIYGIKSITLRREPVDSKIMTAAHIMTQNEIKDLMNKNGVDTLYHISMVVEIIDANGQSVLILLEKNDVINIDVISKIQGGPTMQYLNVDIGIQKLTLGTMLQKTMFNIGPNKYFIYNAINANCGIFIIDILQSNGLYKESYKDFLYQVPYYNTKDISQNSINKMTILTKLGSLFSHLKGKGLSPVVRFL